MAPVGQLFVADGVIIGVVAVEGQHGLMGRVIGNGHVTEEVGTCGVTGHAQPAGFIVAASSADSVHEHLVPLIDNTTLFLHVGGSMPLTAIDEFVEGLQHEEVSLVLELLCNLGPDSCDFFFHLLVHLLVVHCALQVLPVVTVVFPVVFVVMGIEDDLEAGVLSKAHHLVDTVQPHFVQFVLRSLANVSHPRNGNAHAGKALGLYTVESGLRSRFPLPGGLGSYAISIGIKVVAHVPAKTQLQGAGDSGVTGQHRVLDDFLACLGHGNLYRRAVLGRHSDLRAAGLVGLVGGQLELNGHLVFAEDTVLKAEPAFRGRGNLHLGTGRSLNGYLLRFSFWCGLNRGRGYGKSPRSLRLGGAAACLSPLAAAASRRYHAKNEKLSKISHSYVYLSEGIDSRVTTSGDDINCFQYSSVL